MPNSQISKISVLLFDGFSMHCLANAIEPLRAANTISGRQLYDWQFTSVTGTGVVSSSGLPVGTDVPLRHAQGDLLMVMPSYGFRGFCTFPVERGLRSAAGRFGTIAGYDTGAWLLAHSGLLDGYEATIHWEEFSEFAQTFPAVLARRLRSVRDRDRITCTGAAAVFDLTLELLAEAHGRPLAMQVAELFMTRIAEDTGPDDAQNPMVQRVSLLMRDHVEQPLKIAEIARQMRCSQRTLEMRVKADLGLTPQGLYRRVRLSQARKLLEETPSPIAEVALACGYENASALSRAFRGEFGVSPSAMRARSAQAPF